MILDKLKSSPEKVLPIAMALIVVGLSCLLIGIAWPTYTHAFMQLGTGTSDFLHGLFFGVAIALELGGVVLAASAAAAAARKN